jgi:aminoglycoside 3-N-acetyltransferase
MTPQALKRGMKLFFRAASHEWYASEHLIHDLKALGVREAGVLLVHSSLSSLGFVRGGARTVIDALFRTIGPNGTLVMPTHSWDRAARGDFTFDVVSTPSCVGRITELFRTMPGVTRSLHPTHSVAAAGPRAKHLTQGHEAASTPCGKGTPYAKLIEEPCQILFLGTTLDQNTMLHTIEAFCDLPYLLQREEEPFTIRDAHGMVRICHIRRHNRGPSRRFAETRHILERHEMLRKGTVGRSQSLMVECEPMVNLLLDTLKGDPHYLLA